MKKQKKKKRLRKGRLFFLLILLFGLLFLATKYINIPIRNIVIEGNNYLSNMEIIEIAKLEDYPSILNTYSFDIKKRLKKNPYIKNVKVIKVFRKVKIKIEENKVLYINKETNEKVTLNNKINDNKILCAPYLSNEVPDKKLNLFNENMNEVNKDILCKMSEIYYDPNDIDDNRIRVIMNDNNIVYLTINKINKINKYDTILESIGKQDGIINLDYGDYFEPK